jgi:hypothetical protein
MELFGILQPVADAAFRRYAAVGFDRLSEEEQTVILVWSLEGEVDNGGFDQFYFNSSGNFAAETVETLRRIGASRTAELVEEANRLFPTQPPPRERAARIAELDSFTGSMSVTLDRLDREFHRDPDCLEKLLFAYMVRQGLLPREAEDSA